MKQAYVYIMASKKHGTLYIGITTDLIKRVLEHKAKSIPSFTSKYHITRLVYAEGPMDLPHAITREKNLKKWKRSWKIDLIENSNPTWKDHFHDIN